MNEATGKSVMPEHHPCCPKAGDGITWLLSGLSRPPPLGVPGIFATVVLLAMELWGGVLAGSGLIEEKLERLIKVEGPNWFIICWVLGFRS